MVRPRRLPHALAALAILAAALGVATAQWPSVAAVDGAQRVAVALDDGVDAVLPAKARAGADPTALLLPALALLGLGAALVLGARDHRLVPVVLRTRGRAPVRRSGRIDRGPPTGVHLR